jgi:hypothetical protein
VIEDVHAKLNPVLARLKQHSSIKILFSNRLNLNLMKKLLHCYTCVVLKFGHLGMCIRNTWKVLKCGGGEGWKR